ncbi:putative phloem protein [Rosa chinensis]|uniref:Putative phloem protein n=1 Tax=Rosa chinensis TaxID=74649 RepID=A0A2P6R5S4_ROSCH|nr:putative phloem protein [Rosa chinensis]
MPSACRCSLRCSSQRRNPTPFETGSFRLRHPRSCPSPANLDYWPPNPRRSFTSLSATNVSSSTTVNCLVIGIIWGDAPQYWRWTSHPESRFQEVAELLDVCWLEINGKLETRVLSPSTLYKAYLSFKFTPEAYGFKHKVAGFRRWLSFLMFAGLKSMGNLKHACCPHRLCTKLTFRSSLLQRLMDLNICLRRGEHSKQTVFFPNEGEMDYSEVEMDFSE